MKRAGLCKATYLLWILLVLPTIMYAQEEPVIVTGNELIGRVENGMTVREVNGNVVLRQGNVVITCDKAIQFLAANNAHLIGRVVVKQDTLTIRTPEGYYYGNDKRAYSDRGVILDDKKVTLTAVTGEYFFRIAKADFRSNVVLKDSASTMFADRLYYFRRENKAISFGNVSIIDSVNKISADSLLHLRMEEITDAYGNVSITNYSDNITIYGQHATDYRKQSKSIVDKDPLLIQCDTTFDEKKKDSVVTVDTLIIKSGKMEAVRDSNSVFTAIDSVKIIRGVFLSRNDQTVYYRTKEQIVTNRLRDTLEQPVMWYDNTQLTGDSIRINLQNKKITSADVIVNALVISSNKDFAKRFDQVAGDHVRLFFNDNKLNRTDVLQNMLSIYYMYDNGEPNGLVKASSLQATIMFENNKVDEVHLYKEPKSEFQPELAVKDKEKQFTLPQFKLVQGKPEKAPIFKEYKNSRFRWK